ncbi:MAG: glutamine--fructose-6-phosphate transaminase (isomerizing) [Candidatus Coatesbacteria bacterium]
MCGIVGYVGTGKATPVILDGLARLEYRGYDSAGIAVIEDGVLKVRRRAGRLAQLVESLKLEPIEGSVGIGHTRWATHGAPSEKNSHPHCDCRGDIAVVHNGIIENYQELKNQLEARGHVFKSETDTEVVAHLLEEEFTQGAPSLVEAARRALPKAKGAYALGLLRRQEPGVLVAARLGSPLIVGLGSGENYVASDVPAILSRTRNIVYLNDGEVIELTPTAWKVTDLNGVPREHPVSRIEWSVDAAEKGGFEKFMLKEIHEQPRVIRETLMGRISADKKSIQLKDMNLSVEELKSLKKMFIVSCGTAFHAGYVGKYLLEHFTNLPVEVDLASEFRYRSPKMDKDTVIFTVTQSGETADTLASVRAAKAKGCKVISICNVVGSSIARESHGVIYTNAGPEIGVASTKAYTAQLTAFCLFTIYYGKLTGSIPDEKAADMIRQLEGIPDKVDEILKDQAHIKALATKYAQAPSWLYLGRKFNFPTALEGALKNKEITYTHAEGFAAGEMKHGPIALIHKEMPILCIAPRGETYEKMTSNIREVGARAGRIICVATRGDADIAGISEDVIYVPETPEEFSPILCVVPLQLLAYYCARARGCDIDKPRNLAKSVTVE